MRRNVFLAVLLVVLSLLVLTACGQSEQAGVDQSKENNADTQAIKLGGSSTLAPVVAKCADEFHEQYKTWNKVDPGLPEEQIVIFVSSGGSGFGVKSTIDGTVDIGMVSREIKAEEKEKMPNGKYFQVGTDALTIAVNPKNPILQVKPNLTTEEVRKIFAGEIKTWRELDAKLPDRPIVVAVRDLGGGASKVFDKIVMKGTPVSKEAIQLPSMGALAGKVMENVDAIGYVSYGLVNQNEGKIAVLSVDGVAPTKENITGGGYKISRPLLLLTKDTPGTRQQLFIDYMLSEEGQKIVEKMGFIPVK
ncbi:phosphate transport system substrate-binding protein [Desulfohalotomaculum tongense]|uniref:phosphate ABC transporter substrate-binding protein n=1 Tax=Desulforadius tongensis TaxID=1216062 RepID=UPI00195A70E5|nr:phosphate ABC transporter substrate-binding protein [Desulforadius tongensis]MBM7853940.1 phosphate transport system substrate-binding protein [Desulforadius tongensis]